MGPLGLDLCAIIVRVETPRAHLGIRAGQTMPDRIEYRGCAIKASPMSTADGEWTHEGHIERDLPPVVDMPGFPGANEPCLVVQTVHEKRMIGPMARLQP